jgi:hypothetical protein
LGRKANHPIKMSVIIKNKKGPLRIKLKIIVFIALGIVFSIGNIGFSDKNIQPDLVSGSSETQKLLLWAKKEFLLCKSKPTRLVDVHNHFIKLLNHFETIPAEKIKSNKRYFGDLQELKLQYKKILYLQGLFAINNEWNLKQTKEVKKRLDDLKAEEEFSAPILYKLGEYDLYYKRYRKLIEIYDSKPEKLVFKPQLPPMIIVKENCAINTLHNIVAIYELSKKNYWNPSIEIEKNILNKIADQYQKNKLDSYALATLNLASESNRNEKFNTKIRKLQKKIEKEDKVKSADDLY